MNKYLLGIILFFSIVGCSAADNIYAPKEFSGSTALNHVEKQLSFGPRVPGSQAHADCLSWIEQKMIESKWIVERQTANWKGLKITNLVAKNKSGNPEIIVGAHFDSRKYADQDPNPANELKPVPGANDGASGVAVLVELARVLPHDLPKVTWFVFFDAEDQGDIDQMNWIIGSTVFARSLKTKPDIVVILDMVGDQSLNLHFERNSNLAISQSIWAKAAQLGYKQFIPTPKHSLLDDHTPFLELGIPAVDIIDFDYPSWHTISDTFDQVSGESLEAVGRTMYAWLVDQK